RDLDAFLRGLRDLLGRFVSVCNTVAFAHNRGVLHRDLKLQNVMLGKYSETLVVDWGLAKPFDREQAAKETGEETLLPRSVDDDLRSAAGAIGTPAYMSPEQAEGRPGAHWPASDIYGLGAILYAILTGQPPTRGSDLHDSLHRAARGEFPPPRQVCREVPRPL